MASPRPSPEPPFRPGCAWRKRSKRCGSAAGSMPGPVSWTAKRTPLPLRLCAQRDLAALVGELNGVADQIGEDLQHAVAVREHGRQLFVEPGAEAQRLLARERLQEVERVAHQPGHGVEPAAGESFAGLDARDLEQIPDQLIHLLGRRGDPLELLAHPADVGVAVGTAELLGHGAGVEQHRRQRVAQVVRDDGEHAVAGAHRLPGLGVEARVVDGDRGAARDLLGEDEVLGVVIAAGLRGDEGDGAERAPTRDERDDDEGAQLQALESPCDAPRRGRSY